jgi:hypothetical protein
VSTNPAFRLNSRVITELFIGLSCLQAFYLFVANPTKKRNSSAPAFASAPRLPIPRIATRKGATAEIGCASLPVLAPLRNAGDHSAFRGEDRKKLDDDQIGAFDPERESPFL